MPHVQVTIAGRSYRMACGEGEEDRIQDLAAGFDGRIAEMRSAFGEIGDMRLHVMAALATADELAETGRRIAALEREVAALRSLSEAEAKRAETADRQVAEALSRSAARLERVAGRLAPPVRPE